MCQLIIKGERTTFEKILFIEYQTNIIRRCLFQYENLPDQSRLLSLLRLIRDFVVKAPTNNGHEISSDSLPRTEREFLSPAYLPWFRRKRIGFKCNVKFVSIWEPRSNVVENSISTEAIISFIEATKPFD